MSLLLFSEFCYLRAANPFPLHLQWKRMGVRKKKKRLFTVLGFYFSEVPRGGNKKALGWLTGGDVKCLPLQREVFRLPLTNCFPSQSFPRKIHIFYASGSNSLLKEKTLTNMMADGCRGSSLLISLFLPIALIFHL